MRIKTIVGLAVATAIVLAGISLWAAFGGSPGSYAPASASAAQTSTSERPAVNLGKTALGDVLVDANGLTLYGFTDDATGTSSCTGTCAQNWPPATVGAGWAVGSGLDRANFHTITRDDGEAQLAAGKWPLYTFAGDSQPGDVNGQGSLGKWFVVRSDGTLVKDTPSSSTPSTTAPATSGYGY
jgi:predicted lipoprotein with Yx(FWY)xxD motif